MDKKITIGAIVVLLIIIAGAGYYLATPKGTDTITIGHIAPLTGDAAMYGEWESQGINLAVAEINAKGGINGKQLTVIHEDDQLDPKTGTNALTKLITVDKVPAVIGATGSSVTLAIAPIAEKNKVVLISDGAAAIKVSDAGDYIFRVFPSNALEGKKLVELASSLNLKNGAIIYINNDFGTDLSKVVSDEFTKNGGTIAISEGYDPAATDFRTQLTKVQAKNPDVIFLLGYPKDMAILLKQAKELGIKTQFLAPDTFNEPQIIEWGGNATEGVIFVYPGEGEPGRWKDFNLKINTTYGKNANIMTAMAYDTTYLIATAMQNSGVSGEAIKNGLYQINDYPGVTGNITFDKNGDVISRVMDVKIVKDGKFEGYKNL